MSSPARRFARLAVVVGAACSVLLFAAVAQGATATLNTPATGATYGPIVAVDYSLDSPPQNTIRLEFSYASGPNASAGSTWTVLLNGVTAVDAFSFPAANPVASSNVASVTPSNGATGAGLPDGTYDVTLKYEPSSPPTSTVSSATHTGVTIDSVTLAPLLTSPTSSFTSGAPLAVAYTLPEAALSGSATLTFSSPSTTRAITLAASGEAAGTHSFALDPGDPFASPAVSSIAGGPTIPDGTYDVVIAYSDALGNPVATDTATSVRIDTTAPAPAVPAAPSVPPVTQPAPQQPTTPPTIARPAVPQIKATWKSSRAKGTSRRTFSVRFARQRGARSYILAATSGGDAVLGSCRARGKGRRASVRCAVRVRGSGTWQLKLSAVGSSGATIAAASKRFVGARAA